MFEFLSVGRSEHRRVTEMLSAYIDGELSARERARVDRHLAGCADCRWELETLRQTVGLLGQLPAVPVPRSFTVRERDVSRRAAPSPSRRAYAALRGATALAALLLAVVVAGDVFLHTAMRGAAPAMAPAREMAVPTRPPQPPAAAPTPTVVADQETEKAMEEPANAYGAATAPMATPSPVPQGMAAAPPTATPEPVLGETAAEKAAEPHAVEATAAPPGEEAPQPTPTLGDRQATAMPAGEPKAAPTATPRPTAAPPTPPATLRASPTPAAVAGAMAATPTAQIERPPQGAVAAGERLRLAPVRLAEAGLCLLVMVLAAVTVVVGRRS